MLFGCSQRFLSIYSGFLLLRIEFRTKWPWPIEAFVPRVIDTRADGYIVADLRLSHHSSLQVDGWMRSGRTGDAGARGKRHRGSHRNHQERSTDGIGKN